MRRAHFLLPLVPVAALAVFHSDAGDRHAVASAVFAKPSRHALRFETNEGQFGSSVRFVARHGKTTLALTDEGAALRVSSEVLTMKVHGGKTVAPASSDLLETKTNYFLGKDPSKWRTDVPNFGKVTYPGVLAGVDLVYHGEEGQLEYDFVVAPGADPASVSMDVGGDASRVSLNAEGALVIHTATGDIVQAAPRVYQREREIRASYRIVGDKQVGFEVASYDRAQPLVIDPVLSYATFIGGSGADEASSVATDGTSAYVVGNTASVDFPATTGALSKTFGAGGSDAFIAKLNATGTAYTYATYLGGTGFDEAYGVALTAAGEAFIAGRTNSTDFPTKNPFQADNGGDYDIYVAKLNAAGNALIYSTYVGGSDTEYLGNLATDGTYAFINGDTVSTDFPTKNPVQADNASAGSGYDSFVAKLAMDGSSLAWSTYYGGSDDETTLGLAVSADGVFAAGTTTSIDYPTVTPFQGNPGGGANDSFVCKLSLDGQQVKFASYLGGSDEEGGGDVAIDAAGNAVVAGATLSTDFPTVAAYQATKGAGSDAFLAKIKADGSAVMFATYLGGAGVDEGWSVTVRASGDIVVAGNTSSSNFPQMNATQATFGGAGPAVPSVGDGFVTMFKSDGSLLNFSTFYGGVSDDVVYRVAVAGTDIYAVGATSSPVLTGADGGAGKALDGAEDGFLVKLVNGASQADAGTDAGSGTDSGSGGDSGSGSDAGTSTDSGTPSPTPTTTSTSTTPPKDSGAATTDDDAPADSSGCGCRTSGTPRDETAGGVLLALGLALAARRRRSSRA